MKSHFLSLKPPLVMVKLPCFMAFYTATKVLWLGHASMGGGKEPIGVQELGGGEHVMT